MDDHAFDHLTRRLAAPASRRGLLAGLAALVPAPALARKKKPPVQCAADGAPCAGASGCCGGGCNKAGPCTVKKKGKTKLTGNCRCFTVPCSPDCAGKACGGDGCGGTCGTCADGGSCVDGACACPAAKPTECQGACVDTGTSEHHCGGCGQACPAASFCSGGRCYCPIGTTYCRAAAACVDTYTSPGNCGRCGNACAANQTCADGECRTDCPVGQRPCGSVCISAGDCCADADCADGRICRNGSCACRPGTDVCDDACVRLDTDEVNCGACGAACPSGARCLEGDCFCPRNLVVCDDACTNLDTNDDHCGRCHAKCSVGRVCDGGKCRAVEGTCPPTYDPRDLSSLQCDGSNFDCFCWQSVEGDVRCYQGNSQLEANCTSSAECEALAGRGAFCALYVPQRNFPGWCYKPCES